MKIGHGVFHGAAVRFLVDFVVEIQGAPTQSSFSDFLLSLCKVGHVLQPRGGGALMTLI